MALKTDYKDDVLDTSVNTRRKYNLITNDDGTVSFEDVTEYLQTGDSFGAQEMNELSGTSELSALNHQTLGYSKKNLLKNTATTQTLNGVTITVNDDGSVKVDGTASGTTLITINDSITLKANNSYILTGCPSGGDINTYRLHIFNVDGTYILSDVGKGHRYTPSVDTNVKIAIRIQSGLTVDNLTFYPMIRDARILDDTYEPYVDDVDTRIVNMKSNFSQQVLTFTNKTVATSAWKSSSNEDFPYYVDVTCSGVTSSYVPNVNFSLADANSGIFSTVAETVSGAVRIYASEKPTATVTIPSIQCIKSV